MKAPLLVTGANSFVGSNLIRFLVHRNEFQIVATYRNNKEALMNPCPSHLKYVHCDLSDINSVCNIFKHYDIKHIIHLAAAVPNKSEANYAESLERDNILPLNNLLETKAFFAQLNYKIKTKILKNCEHSIPTEASSLALNFIKKNLYG